MRPYVLLTLCVLFAIRITAQDLNNGLVAYFPFDGTLTDAVSGTLTAVPNGTAFSPNRFGENGKAIRFDGLDDYLRIDDQGVLNFGDQPFSVSFWILADGTNPNIQMVFQKGDSGGENPQYWLRIRDYENSPHFRFAVTEGMPPASTATIVDPVLFDSKWHHVVVKRTLERLEIWVDCKLYSGSDNVFRNTDTDTDMLIGVQHIFPDGTVPILHNFLSGDLDEMRFYDRDLTPAEILLLGGRAPSWNLPSDTLICQDSMIAISTPILPGQTILWSDGSTSAERILEFPGTYTVNLSDIDCLWEEETVLENKDCTPVDPPDELDCKFMIPNVFTPNGDGINDEFKVYADCTFQSYHMKVFNRWGALVFETDVADKPWNGTFKPGAPGISGVYVYYVSFSFEEGGKIYQEKGDVTLLDFIKP